MLLDTILGRLLDNGSTYENTVWPILVAFSIMALFSTFILMGFLQQKAKLEAEEAAAAVLQAGKKREVEEEEEEAGLVINAQVRKALEA